METQRDGSCRRRGWKRGRAEWIENKELVEGKQQRSIEGWGRRDLGKNDRRELRERKMWWSRLGREMGGTSCGDMRGHKRRCAGKGTGRGTRCSGGRRSQAWGQRKVQ